MSWTQDTCKVFGIFMEVAPISSSFFIFQGDFYRFLIGDGNDPGEVLPGVIVHHDRFRPQTVDEGPGHSEIDGRK